MAAFLGSARQWQLLHRKIKVLQKRDGFTVFHAKDFRGSKGEFRGWDEAKCRRLVNDLATAIRYGLDEGVTTSLPRELYETEYRGGGVPKGMTLDSQYGVCFRACLWQLVKILIADKKHHKLHVVIESGHPNATNTRKIFDEVNTELVELNCFLLGTLTIADKGDCWPLMLADFQAYASHLSEARLKVGQPGYFEMVEQLNNERKVIPAREAALTQIQHTAESLRQLKIDWQKAKDDRMAKWRKARDGRKTSLANEQIDRQA